MKRMWARVGMSFELFDDEYEEFITNCRGDNTQRAKAQQMFVDWIENGIAKFDGESYFPEQGCFGDSETDNVEEIAFEF